jgi:diguanylate cyclase
MEPTLAGIPDSDSVVANLTTIGLVAVDRNFCITLWSRFMELNSNVLASEVCGKNLFDAFPELNRHWLEKKMKSCLILKAPSFSSWRQRPYLFRFQPSLRLADGADFMHQDATIFPVRGAHGTVQGVCISIQDVSELAEAARQLEQVTEQALELTESNQRDALTSLRNRRCFDSQLAESVAGALRYGRPLAMAMLDIDHFKAINDLYGHPGGDMVLRAVGGRIQSMLRSTDVLYRYGGEEFAVLLPGCALDEAAFLLDRLREAIEAQVLELGGGVSTGVTISIGVAALRPEQTPEHLLAVADAALYQSKRSGRNRVTCDPQSPP